MIDRDDLRVMARLLIYAVFSLVIVAWLALAIGLGLKIFQLVSH